MTIIADSGSSKTDWALISDSKDIVRFSSIGFNPNFASQDTDFKADVIKSIPSIINPNGVERVFFYGAGINTDNKSIVKDLLNSIFPCATEVTTESDLIGAARSLLGKEKGFAAILGTGTNSCIFDGDKIIYNVDSMGFILGDEGSGAYMGKQLIYDYLRKRIPEDIRPEIAALIGKTRNEIIEQIYRKPYPNRYCASFCRFIIEHRHEHIYYNNLVTGSFQDFFRNIVTLYPGYSDYILNAVGSVAFHAKDILNKVAEEYGMGTGRIIKSPIDGLIDYYKG